MRRRENEGLRRKRYRWASVALAAGLVALLLLAFAKHRRHPPILSDPNVVALSKEKQVLICKTVKSDQNATPFASEECDPSKTFKWELVELKRSLLGDGAHRQLKTNVMWRKQLQRSMTSTSEDQCSVTLLERLPNGVFVDEYELHRLRQRGVFHDVHVYGDKNLELPAIHSNQSIVEVHRMTTVLKEVDALSLQAEISVTLHSRYPPLRSEAYFVLNISSADVVLTCSHEQGDGTVHDDPMRSYEAQESTQLVCGKDSLFSLSSLRWPVPAGNPEHFNFVSLCTGLAAISGVIYIWLVSHLSRCSEKTPKHFMPGYDEWLLMLALWLALTHS